MDKKLGFIVSICVFVGMIVSANAYLAKAKDLRLVEYRLDQKITNDKLDAIQQRIWTLEDRYEGRPVPQSVKEECRKLKEEKKKLEKILGDKNAK